MRLPRAFAGRARRSAVPGESRRELPPGWRARRYSTRASRDSPRSRATAFAERRQRRFRRADLRPTLRSIVRTGRRSPRCSGLWGLACGIRSRPLAWRAGVAIRLSPRRSRVFAVRGLVGRRSFAEFYAIGKSRAPQYPLPPAAPASSPLIGRGGSGGACRADGSTLSRRLRGVLSPCRERRVRGAPQARPPSHGTGFPPTRESRGGPSGGPLGRGRRPRSRRR